MMKNMYLPSTITLGEATAAVKNIDLTVSCVGVSEEDVNFCVEAMTEAEFEVSGQRAGIGRLNIDRLSPLIQAMPGVATATQVASVNYMEVVINGSLAATKDGDGFRAFTTIGKGIKENARLYGADRLRNLVQGGALLQLASGIVAQKHLADISEKLSEIKQCVDQVQAFQNDERKSRIVGTLDYLEQAACAILRGEQSPSVRQQLEQCERDLLCIQNHLVIELRNEISALKTIKDPDTFGTSGLTNAIKKYQDRVGVVYLHWALCVRVRVAAWHLLATFDSEYEMVSSRGIAIAASIELVHGERGLIVQLNSMMRTKIHSMKSIFEVQLSTMGNKMMLENFNEKDQNAFRQSGRDMENRLQKGFSICLEKERPVHLAIRIADGQIAEAYHLAEPVNSA